MGEGKTSLISAMLGELPPLENSTAIIRGTAAYVRENILFGSKFEASRYWKIVQVIALQHDLDIFPGHDLTEIGERGVNISDGQKQRVSMARAVYSNSDVYIFDDPLSALDTHVGREVDKIILVSEGMVKEEGTFEELSENGLMFNVLMEKVGRLDEHTDGSDCRTNLNNGSSKQYADEVAAEYTDALGGLWVVMILFTCYISTKVLRILSSTWLSYWTEQSSTTTRGHGFYILIYALLSLGEVLVTFANSFWLISSSLHAAKTLHDTMLHSVLRAPTTFFQTNPIGRMINRFANDLGDIDRNVANLANQFLNQVWQLLSTFVLIVIVSTVFLWAITPLLFLFYAAYLYYQFSRTNDQVAFASTIGLLLSYSLNITNLMSNVLRQASRAENNFNAVERVGTYIDLPSEAPSVIEKSRPPPGWPSLGVVEFENVGFRYRHGLPSVLHGLSFSISPTEKIGIVGRTGAGKSTIINALFRLELDKGRILIDNYDISRFGLTDLRKVLGIIPQSPVLFSGMI
ncbi:hypothetical protein L1987_83350 [Smallanthus sonchifolius]|uniref:Uncharacterized protein n=1 Tax=Smallanthus sonchifolius TaxID=185202 RepID=A0ACB8YC21_9ASTR|nr:hypothetical protein L1987_83350 [Smallanthus sonchifolius]